METGIRKQYDMMYSALVHPLYIMFNDGKLGQQHDTFKEFFEDYTKYLKEIGTMDPEVRAQIDRQFCIAIAGGPVISRNGA